MCTDGTMNRQLRQHSVTGYQIDDRSGAVSVGLTNDESYPVEDEGWQWR